MIFNLNHLIEIQKCADPVTGPEYFLTTYFKVPDSEFKMHDYCKRFLHNIHSNQQSINLLSRQLGKTTMSAGYALWVALFAPSSSILLSSANLSMAKNMMRCVHYGYDNLPEFLKISTTSIRVDALHFDNGSFIKTIAISESAGRGMTISLMIIDELAFVNTNTAKNMMACVMPCLALGGKLVITSSYNTSADVFGELWEDANNKVNLLSPFEAKWNDHPDHDIAWAVEQELSIGRTAFRKEHMNQELQET